MPLRPLYGHEAVRSRLANAIAAGRLPQSLLIEGPRGVGKQRLALWLAQLVLCEGDRRDEPCSACRSCKQVLTLQHPDLSWYVPLEATKKSGDADKQVDLVEEALAEEMARRRDEPLYEAPPGTATHSIATVRLLLRRLSLTPVMGGWRVVIVGDAERLVPQQANPDAANALLKILEEPPARTVLILTSSEPDALLRTVVSRVVRVRLTILHDSVVTSFAQNELSGRKKGLGSAPDTVRAAGSIGRLLASEGGAGQSGAAASFLAATRKDAVARYGYALGQQTYQARGGFTAMLDALLERLRRETQAGGNTEKLVEAIAQVAAARVAAQGNVNPQLLTAVLADRLAGGSAE